VQRLFARLTFHLHAVRLRQLVPRIGDVMLQCALGGQYHQAFAIGIQPARRVHVALGKKIAQRGAP
jgi:hypothetical protein